MKILIDTNILIQMLDARDDTDFPSIKNGVVGDIKLKLEKFFDYIDKKEVCITAITLSEFLQKISKDKRQRYITTIKKLAKFSILAFDEIAAYEMADIPLAKNIASNPNISNVGKTAAALKLDRQIVAIAIANNIDEVWTQDKGMLSLLSSCLRSDRKKVVAKSFDDISLEGTISDMFE